MKRTLLVICCLLFPLQISAYDKNKELSPEAQVQMEEQASANAERLNSIKLIEGTPQRKFIKLAPLWEKDKKIEKAINKLKKHAIKLGADAVIDFEYGAGYHGSATVVGGVGSATEDTVPVVSGWAVKWVD